jgi:hypothetical protein
LAGTLLFDEEIRQSAALFDFGFRDVGILYSRAVIQRTIDGSPAFLEHSLAEKITVRAHANRDPKQVRGWFIFSMKLLTTLNSYQIFKIKNNK